MNWRKIVAFCLVAVFITFTSGCETLKTYEKYEYQKLEYRLQKAGLPPQEPKDETLAAVLNILPGIGNIYLEQWALFVVNLLFWPASILWGVPQAYADAKNINQKETLYFFKIGPGKDELEQLEREKGITLSDEEFKALQQEKKMYEKEDLESIEKKQAK